MGSPKEKFAVLYRTVFQVNCTQNRLPIIFKTLVFGLPFVNLIISSSVHFRPRKNTIMHFVDPVVLGSRIGIFLRNFLEINFVEIQSQNSSKNVVMRLNMKMHVVFDQQGVDILSGRKMIRDGRVKRRLI